MYATKSISLFKVARAFLYGPPSSKLLTNISQKRFTMSVSFGEFRDLDKWNEIKFPLFTNSNACARLFDKVIHELYGWNGNPLCTVSRCIAEDEGFCWGYIVEAYLNLVSGFYPPQSPAITGIISKAKKCTVYRQSDGHSKVILLKRHIQALEHWFQGNVNKAAKEYEEALDLCPLDPLALFILRHVYYNLGWNRDLRELMERMDTFYKPSNPLYGYVKGIQAFAYEEDKKYSKALECANLALEINPCDGWAVHSMAHLLDAQGEYRKGILFLEQNERYWTQSNCLAAHCYWHLCLNYYELNDFSSSLDIFDRQILPNIKHGSGIMDIVDGASLLWRLDSNGVNVGDRWKYIENGTSPFLKSHFDGFYELHLLLGHSNSPANLKPLVTDIQAFTHKDSKIYSYRNEVYTKLINPTAEAILLYSEKKFNESAERLYPLLDSLVLIGGSQAQRDVFNQLFIRSAVQGSNSWKLRGIELLSKRLEEHPNNSRETLLYKSLLDNMKSSRWFCCNFNGL